MRTAASTGTVSGEGGRAAAASTIDASIDGEDDNCDDGSGDGGEDGDDDGAGDGGGDSGDGFDNNDCDGGSGDDDGSAYMTAPLPAAHLERPVGVALSLRLRRAAPR